jgi:hypothetical protein
MARGINHLFAGGGKIKNKKDCHFLFFTLSASTPHHSPQSRIYRVYQN